MNNSEKLANALRAEGAVQACLAGISEMGFKLAYRGTVIIEREFLTLVPDAGDNNGHAKPEPPAEKRSGKGKKPSEPPASGTCQVTTRLGVCGGKLKDGRCRKCEVREYQRNHYQQKQKTSKKA